MSARKLMVAILLSLLLVGSMPAITPGNNISQAEDNLVLVVMPYYLQEHGDNDERFIVLYAFEHIYAVIDLNHNGVQDPDEPVIEVHEPGKTVYAVIGTSSLLPPYYLANYIDGPVWLLVRPPVMVSYLEYNHLRDSYVASYNAPPPGTRIIVPPIPGNVYISPASPEGARVTVTGGPYNGETYTLGPDEYLVLNSFNRPITIESDRPVAAVLANEDPAGSKTFATELVPLDPNYVTIAVLPFPESYLNRTVSGEYLRSYYYIVSMNGTVETGRYMYPATIQSITGEPGIAYVLLHYENPLGQTESIGIAPVYRAGAHPMYRNSMMYIAKMAVQTPLSVGDRYINIHLVPHEDNARIALAADTNNDMTAEIYLEQKVREGSIAPLTGTVYTPQRVNIIYDDFSTAYQFYSTGGFKYILLRYIATPIPIDSENNITFPLILLRDDLMLRIRELVPSLTVYTDAGGANFAEENGKTVVSILYYTRLRASPQDCANTTIVGFVLNQSLRPLTLSLAQGTCNMTINRGVNATSSTLAVYLQSYLIKDNTTLPLEGFTKSYTQQPATIPGETPDITISYTEDGVYTYQATIPPAEYGNYRNTSLLAMPENYKETLEDTLGIIISQPSQPAENQTNTTTGTPEQPGQPILPPGVTIGQTLEYTLTIEGSGPNGSVNTQATLRIKVGTIQDRIALTLESTDLDRQLATILLLVYDISDLYDLALEGQGSSVYYHMNGTPIDQYKCPILSPGKSGTTTLNDNMLGLNISTICTYSNGLLQTIQTTITGQTSNGRVDISITATLGQAPQGETQNTQPGETGGGGGEKGGFPIWIVAVIAVIVLAGAIMFFRKR